MKNFIPARAHTHTLVFTKNNKNTEFTTSTAVNHNVQKSETCTSGPRTPFPLTTKVKTHTHSQRMVDQICSTKNKTCSSSKEGRASKSFYCFHWCCHIKRKRVSRSIQTRKLRLLTQPVSRPYQEEAASRFSRLHPWTKGADSTAKRTRSRDSELSQGQ